MAKNIGKVFEDNFKKSIPDNVFCYRPPDAAQSFDMSKSKKSKKLRFSSRSFCDYMLYRYPLLFCFELKTVSGTSITFERTKEEKRQEIHFYQIEALKKAYAHGVIAGIIVDFRGSDNTWFLNINEWDDLISNIDKKSFNEQDLIKYTNPYLISKRKLKVNYRYDVQEFLNYLEEKDYAKRKDY